MAIRPPRPPFFSPVPALEDNEVPWRCVMHVHGIEPRQTMSEAEREQHQGALKELRAKIETRLEKLRQLCCLGREYLSVIGCLQYVVKETGK